MAGTDGRGARPVDAARDCGLRAMLVYIFIVHGARRGGRGRAESTGLGELASRVGGRLVWRESRIETGGERERESGDEFRAVWRVGGEGGWKEGKRV